jgi:hypothetical protein
MKTHHIWAFTCVCVVISIILVGCSKKQPEQNTPEQPAFKVTCWSGDNVVYQKQAVYATSSDRGLYVRLSDGVVDYVQGNCVAESI